MVNGKRAFGALGIKPTVGKWVILRLIWNEATWISLGLFGVITLVVLTAQGVHPETQVVFLVELAFPALSSVLVVPLAILDREYNMAEILNAAATSSFLRIGRRLVEVVLVPLLLAIPLTEVLYLIAHVSESSRAIVSPVTLGISAMALLLFLGGLAFSLATVTFSPPVGYTTAPALFVATMVLKRFIPVMIQPFPAVSGLRYDLGAFAVEPITDPGMFWADRAVYAIAGVVFAILALAYLQKSRWGY